MMTRRRRYHGALLLQDSSDMRMPVAPVIIRMTPTMLTLRPWVVTLTAKARIAPTTSRKMLAPMFIGCSLDQLGDVSRAIPSDLTRKPSPGVEASAKLRGTWQLAAQPWGPDVC